MKKEKKQVKRYMCSPINWLGGKFRLATELIGMFPAEFTCYVEVFGGGASVLFALSPQKVEVLNDINHFLINFFRVVQVAPTELIRDLQYELVSRKSFEEFKGKINSNGDLTNVEKAKMFFYIQKNCFGGQGKTFGVATDRAKLNLNEVGNIITNAHNRLAKVSIECLDFRELVPRYDRPHTFFYLDPPYRCPASKAYVKDMKDQDFIELRDILKKIEGKFLLSLNDDSFIRETFSMFRIRTIEATYSVCSKKRKKVNELVITNY